MRRSKKQGTWNFYFIFMVASRAKLEKDLFVEQGIFSNKWLLYITKVGRLSQDNYYCLSNFSSCICLLFQVTQFRNFTGRWVASLEIKETVGLRTLPILGMQNHLYDKNNSVALASLASVTGYFLWWRMYLGLWNSFLWKIFSAQVPCYQNLCSNILLKVDCC